jgi:transposase, IS30 family
MGTSRRARIGPGRRLKSEKRQRFMVLRERGESASGATHKVEVSRSTGNNWTHGYKADRRGVTEGVVAPLDRLAVRKVSSWFLSQG